jgi:hypothetical protein
MSAPYTEISPGVSFEAGITPIVSLKNLGYAHVGLVRRQGLEFRIRMVRNSVHKEVGSLVSLLLTQRKGTYTSKQSTGFVTKNAPFQLLPLPLLQGM